MLLKASDKLGTVASYKFDLVDLGRQVIGNEFGAIYSQYRAAFLKQDKTSCNSLSTQLLVGLLSCDHARTIMTFTTKLTDTHNGVRAGHSGRPRRVAVD